jgi:ORF6N domain
MKPDTLAVQVERRIFLIRGQKVMLDADLAELYGVPTKSLNLAVKRNAERFPKDFMFQLTDDEAAGLSGRGRASLSPVCLRRTGCRHALQRAAKCARRSSQHRHHADICALARDASVARRSRAQARRAGNKYDAQFKVVFDAIRELMQPPTPPRREIGFHVREKATREYGVRKRN